MSLSPSFGIIKVVLLSKLTPNIKSPASPRNLYVVVSVDRTCLIVSMSIVVNFSFLKTISPSFLPVAKDNSGIAVNMVKIVARKLRSRIVSDSRPDSITGTESTGSIIHTALIQRYGSSLTNNNVATNDSQKKRINFVYFLKKSPVLVSAPPPYGKVFLRKTQFKSCPMINRTAVINSGDMNDLMISVTFM